MCRQVLQTLSEGLPDKRWLLIYDNAEDVKQLTPLLPVGGGHVLITSQNERWQDIGTSLEVEKFRPEESVSHLRRRLHGITEADAGRIAQRPAGHTAGRRGGRRSACRHGHVRRRIPGAAGTSGDADLSRRSPARSLPAGGSEGLEALAGRTGDEVRRRRPTTRHLLGHGAGDQPGPDQ